LHLSSESKFALHYFIVANIPRAEASEELIVRHIVGSAENGESAVMI